LKKKIACVLAAVCLLLCLAPAQRAQAVSDVCFISVNDRLLDMTSLAEYISGQWYVPYTTFSDFHINYQYFANGNTAQLFTKEKQYFFDLNYGSVYDGNNKYYSAQGYLVNGVAYVPVAFVCTQFGLNWSYIEGSGYGDICRIKDAAVILPDSQFLSAASDMMASRYKAYEAARNPGAAATQTPTPVSAARVYLSFQGLPGDAILDALEAKNVKAAFFLSYKDILNGADTVRRIAGGENKLGILCDSYEEYQEASAALYEAAHIKTVMVAAPDGGSACKLMAAQKGLVYCGYNADGVQNGKGLTAISAVTRYLYGYDSECYARLLSGGDTEDNLQYLLRYFSNNNCAVSPANEIFHG